MRLETFEVNAPVPDCEPKVVVAMVVASVAEVPYAKPCCVESEPPVLVIFPFSVADEVVTEDAAEVVTVGVVEGVIEFEAVLAVLVPTALVATTVNV